MVAILMRKVAETLAKDGGAFNKQLVKQCEQEWEPIKDSGHSDTESGLHRDHLVFLRSIAQSFGWLHQTDKGRSALVSFCYDLLLVASKHPFDANDEHEGQGQREVGAEGDADGEDGEDEQAAEHQAGLAAGPGDGGEHETAGQRAEAHQREQQR